MTKSNLKINKTVIWLILVDVFLVVGTVVFVSLAFSRASAGFLSFDKKGDETIDRDDLREIKKTMVVFKNDQALFGTGLGGDFSAVSLVQSVEDVGKKSGVDLKIGQADEKNNVINLKLRISGDFSSNVRALKMLENLPFLIQFNKVAIQKNSNLVDGKNFLWSSDVDLSVKSGKK